jgi:hypothetical protein
MPQNKLLMNTLASALDSVGGYSRSPIRNVFHRGVRPTATVQYTPPRNNWHRKATASTNAQPKFTDARQAMKSAVGFAQQHPMITATVASAGLGGTASMITGGSFVQGAMAGAVIGGGGYSGAAYMSKNMGQTMDGYSAKLSSFMSGQENAMMRRATFGAGATMGGLMFGGNRSHRRGFNASRGNSIGR